MLKLWDKMPNKDQQLSNRKHTAWQQGGKYTTCSRNSRFLRPSATGLPGVARWCRLLPKGRWSLSKNSYPKSEDRWGAGTVLVLGCSSHPWCHFIDEGAESWTGWGTSQVRLCLRIPGPAPALGAVMLSSLSCSTIRTALSLSLAFFQHFTLK